MSISIEQINPRNEPALRAWWEAGRAATAERPGRPWPAWEVSRRALPADHPEKALTFLAAIDGRRMVGAGLVVRYLQDNLHAALVEAHVVPERRREGLGSALVREGETVAAGDGRTTLLSETFVPPGGTAPGEAFAGARGYAVAHRESINELELGAYRGRRDRARRTARAAGGYEVVTFDTGCPDKHLASFGRLLGTLMAEIPLGDLDLTDAAWTPERLRAAEERQLAVGRHVLTALALAPDGTVAGASDVRVDDADPTHGQVGITLVDPAHRGHRLGLALKIATHDLAMATYPRLEGVDTSNAESNTHMNAVNEVLGYRTIETLLELQKRL